MWGYSAQIKELKAEIERLREWKKIALSVLTDNQLDFKPARGPTLRQRLSELDKAGPTVV